MFNFLSMQEKVTNARQTKLWSSIFLLHLVISISRSVLGKSHHNQFLSICIVFESNPHHLATLMLIEKVFNKVSTDFSKVD